MFIRKFLYFIFFLLFIDFVFSTVVVRDFSDESDFKIYSSLGDDLGETTAQGSLSFNQNIFYISIDPSNRNFNQEYIIMGEIIDPNQWGQSH